jgi:hypothetical protein
MAAETRSSALKVLNMKHGEQVTVAQGPKLWFL